MKIRRLFVVAVVFGFFVLVYNYYNNKATSPQPVPQATLNPSIQDDIEKILGRKIPDDVKKTELVNGDSRAIVIYDNKFAPPKLSVLADLPDLENEEVYSVSISNGQDKVSLGDLNSFKGGYILDTSLAVDPTEYNNIEITSPIGTILQGILNL